MEKGDPQTEYSDVSENLRHYANMRFAQLTVFAAINGGLVALVVPVFANCPALRDRIIATVLAGIGVFLGMVFLILEHRSALYWTKFKGRAVEIEKQLEYQQYMQAPEREKWLTATHATLALHIAVIVFWIAAIVAAWCVSGVR